MGPGEMVLLQPGSSAAPAPPRELAGGHRHFPAHQREVSSRGQQAICTQMGCPWLADVWPAKARDIGAAAEGSITAVTIRWPRETKGAMRGWGAAEKGGPYLGRETPGSERTSRRQV